MEKSVVYFCRDVDSEKIINLLNMVDFDLRGNVAVKVHSGEEGNQNYIKPDFWKPIIDYVGGNVVECNTAYAGERNTTSKHMKTLDNHGWTKYFNVDLLDAVSPDFEIAIPNGKVLKKNYLGRNIVNYDSMLVLSHFKGHPMGGYGGALKQLSIGCASSSGKAYIHSAGRTLDCNDLWDDLPSQDKFLESMADAASSVINYFDRNIIYVNIMANLSVDCDCCSVAEDPCMNDIGILVSLDPVAIDKACLDLVYNSADSGRNHFTKRVESRNGSYILDAASDLGCGSKEYVLVEVD